jgi:phage baseplate assembly protein W
MAIVLGKKLVLDTAQFKDYAIGITLPIQISDVAFNQSFTTTEQVRSNIKSLLLTKKYERVMQPDLGSGLQELLFEQNTDDFAERLESTINDTMAKWLPYVSVEEIEIDQSNELKDSNSVNVSIKFRVGETPSLDVVTFNVQA